MACQAPSNNLITSPLPIPTIHTAWPNGGPPTQPSPTVPLYGSLHTGSAAFCPSSRPLTHILTAVELHPHSPRLMSSRPLTYILTALDLYPHSPLTYILTALDLHPHSP
eukprot:354522-Chlamydomonas_euryale.AAC.1